jgi:hypothetical protein
VEMPGPAPTTSRWDTGAPSGVEAREVRLRG